MAPTVVMPAASWRTMELELDRVAPREAVLVPLVALDARAGMNPCAELHLDDLAQVVVARALLVARDRQRNEALRVQALPGADGLLNPAIDALIRRHPRLRSCAYLHSHPFAVGSTWPSAGSTGDYEGHLLPLLRRNRGAGLATAFSFIACRARGRGWTLQAFALDDARRIVDLGCARVVADDDPAVVRSLTPSPWARMPLGSLLRRRRHALRQRRLKVVHDALFDGWLRTIVSHRQRGKVVLFTPNDLPARRELGFRIDASGGGVEPLGEHDGVWGAEPIAAAL